MSLINRQQSGFSMIEVLVSILVIGVGLLGLSGLQIASMKGANNAHSRNVASLLAFDIAERMRGNPLGVQGGFYDNNVDCNVNEKQCRNKDTYCTPQEAARFDVQEVMCGVLRRGKREGGAANLLPAGTLEIQYGVDCEPAIINDQETSIKIEWQESKIHDKQQNNDEPREVEICTIP